MKNMKIILVFLSIFAFGLFSSCDIIEAPYTQNEEIEVPQGNERRALLMEFTGIQCTNCPDVSAEAHRIIKKYPGKVIGFNVHSGELARPKNPSQPNFQTSAGNQIYALTNRPFLPSGMVSKFLSPNDATNSAIDWENKVVGVLTSNAKLDIKIRKEAKIQFEVELFETISAELRIAAFIIENGIVGYQLDNSGEIPDYVHDYVLRTPILGNIGADLDLSTLSDNKLIVEADIPTINASWVEQNLNIICFVYDPNNQDVLQVSEIKFSSND
jgi:hypothetical protein